jgi:hypothetical protein
VNLSEYVWVYSPWASGLPAAASDASGWEKVWAILPR